MNLQTWKQIWYLWKQRGKEDWIGRVSDCSVVLERLSQANRESPSKVYVLEEFRTGEDGLPLVTPPASPLCGRSLEEALPRHECCGRFEVEQVVDVNQTYSPGRVVERGSKQWSSRSPQRDGRVCRCKSVSSFFLLLPNILIAATFWRVSLCLPKRHTGAGNRISQICDLVSCLHTILQPLELFNKGLGWSEHYPQRLNTVAFYCNLYLLSWSSQQHHHQNNSLLFRYRAQNTH